MTRPLVVVGTGAVVAMALAASGGVPTTDGLTLVALAVGGSLLASLAGAAVLRGARHWPAGRQALLVVLITLAATVTGVVAASVAMFISAHDLRALLVVLVMSSAVAIGAAMELGSAVHLGPRVVGYLTAALAEGGAPLIPSGRAPTAELRKLAEQVADVSSRLDESRRREQALETSRRELIAWVSHDLRSPLATVRAMTEALDDGVVDDAETVARYHSQIRRDAERLSALVDDLFELSRIHSGSLRLDRRPVPLAEVVADAVESAAVLAQVKGVRLLDEVGDLPEVDVAPTELTRVLRNLLDNAIRHTPPGGSVRVSSHVDPNGAVLSVCDQCGGIPVDDLDRVFDVAFRGDTARNRDERGGGLGLAIAKGLVEAHRGSIEVVNLDDGCSFTVRLPA